MADGVGEYRGQCGSRNRCCPAVMPPHPANRSMTFIHKLLAASANHNDVTLQSKRAVDTPAHPVVGDDVREGSEDQR